MSDEPQSVPPQPTRLGFEVQAGAGYIALKLEDGAVIHVHPIIADVLRTDATDDRGDPVYIVAGGFAVRLMQRPTGEEKK